MSYIIFFISLILSLSFYGSPVWAEESSPEESITPPICQFSGNIEGYNKGVKKSEGDSNYKNIITNVLDELTASLDGSRCAKTVHPTSGYLEMKDCRAGKYHVAEIREGFAGDVGQAEGEKFIQTVYAGQCCIGFDEKSKKCLDPLTTYSLSYEDCVNKNNAFCAPRQWIVSRGGLGILSLYLNQIFIFMAGFSGFVAVAIIIVSAIQIQYSGASGDISQYKDRILRSLSGLVLLFISSLILVAINPDFFK